MSTTKRHFINVTMKEDLYEATKAAAARTDTPVTAWVRQVVIAELERLRSQS